LAAIRGLPETPRRFSLLETFLDEHMNNTKTHDQEPPESSDQDELNWNLLDATARGNLEEVKSLIDRGAQVDTEDFGKKTPLHWAALNGRTEEAKFLIDRGTQVDAEDDTKQTPLYKAVWMGKTEIARLLIERGADPFKAFYDPNEIIKFFKGDISWIPEEVKAKLERRRRSQSAFGRF
jgi:ankyrin repeat protein